MVKARIEWVEKQVGGEEMEIQGLSKQEVWLWWKESFGVVARERM